MTARIAPFPSLGSAGSSQDLSRRLPLSLAMSDDPYEKIVSWNDVYNQTVGLSQEAAEQDDEDWGEEGYVLLLSLFTLVPISTALLSLPSHNY